MYFIGVDLGGTNTCAAVFDGSYNILGRGEVSTRRAPDAQGVADSISEACRIACAEAGKDMREMEYIGVGSPGVIDPAQGRISYWSRYDFRDVPMAELVSRRTALPVYMDNDANAAALGEYIAGAGRGAQSLVAVTLGTGVGAGAVIDGKLCSGFNHAALEVGHMCICSGGIRCSCGRRGCFEAYASVTALIEQTEAAMKAHPESLMHDIARSAGEINGKTSFDAMRAGDETARAVVEKYIEYLACGLVNVINIFQPEILCVSGGISREGETLLAPVREIAGREDYARMLPERTRIVRAQLGNDAGLYGAAALPAHR